MDNNSPEFYQLLAKVIIQLVNSKVDFQDVYWTCVHSLGHEDFRDFVMLCNEKKYAWSYIKDIVEKYYDTNEYYYLITYADLVSLFPYSVISNSSELESLCDTVLKDNPKSIEDYRKGRTNSINHLKGQIMKATKGKADAKLVSEILERKLKA